MDDLISRQAAIDAIEKNAYRHTYLEQIIDIVSALPSAQPESVRGKDCKYSHMTYDGNCKYCDIWFPYEQEYMPGDYYCGSAERRQDG